MHSPGPLAPPVISRPNRKITARSYSCTTCCLVAVVSETHPEGTYTVVAYLKAHEQAERHRAQHQHPRQHNQYAAACCGLAVGVRVRCNRRIERNGQHNTGNRRNTTGKRIYMAGEQYLWGELWVFWWCWWFALSAVLRKTDIHIPTQHAVRPSTLIDLEHNHDGGVCACVHIVRPTPA